MNIEKIVRQLYKIKYFLKNKIEIRVKWLKRSSDAMTLKENKSFKGIHQGERCFILGNGPSLRNENLSLLQGEKVFTVNQVNRLPNFDCIKPTYHFWVDQNFFNIDMSIPEDVELFNVMCNINTIDNQPICFFPIEQKEFCEMYDLDKELNIHYFAHTKGLYDGFDKEIDFTRFTPGCGTVVQNCICMAIYMGFKEIYLLGCDNTGIIVTLKSMLKSNNQEDYAYDVTENEKKRMEKMLERGSVEQYARAYFEAIREYRILYEYCSMREIKLINCSSNTVIDCIPRQGLQEVLKRK